MVLIASAVNVIYIVLVCIYHGGGCGVFGRGSFTSPCHRGDVVTAVACLCFALFWLFESDGRFYLSSGMILLRLDHIMSNI